MQQLPEDVLLQICDWLSIRDIFAIRRLNRYFYSFTRTSNIWLSLLRRLRLILPPGQLVLNTPDYRTVEYFITRSMRYQQNWRWNYNPYPKHYSFSFQNRVNAMVILPGGNHMVSVHEGDDNVQNMMVVWDMSSRGKRNHVAVATIRSRTAVGRLQAGYALVGGHVSLVIAYVRPPDEGRTAVVALSAHLALLNEMSRLVPGTHAYEEFMKCVKEPFENLLETTTRYPVGAISLSEVDGVPFLAVVHRPRTIAFYNLISKTRSILKLRASKDYMDWRHSIWCIKILSSQKQILVVRVLIDGEVDSSDNKPIVFELYNIPATGYGEEDDNNDRGEESHTHPVERRVILGHNIEGCYISVGDSSWNFRTYPDPDVSMLHMLTRVPPPPLSIFVVTKEKRGFFHYISNPEKAQPETRRYRYNLPVMAHAYYDWEEQETPVIFPGGYHSIVIMRPALSQPADGFSILQLCTYQTETYEFSGPGDTGYSNSEQRLNSNEVHKPYDLAMKYPVLPKDLAQSMRRGTRCLQFDEWLGRLFVTTASNPCLIHVLDWSI